MSDAKSDYSSHLYITKVAGGRNFSQTNYNTFGHSI